MKRPRNKDTKDVARRFVKAMNSVVAEKIAAGEKYSNVDFADSIGYTRSNMTKLNTLDRIPTVPIIIKLCRVHKVNPTWLILGEGEMMSGKKNDSLEERVRKLEKQIKKAAH